MKEFNVDKINQGYFFSQPAYLDEDFVLLSQEMSFTGEFGEILKEWRFFEIKSDGEPQDYYSGTMPEKKANPHITNDAAKVEEAQKYIIDLEKFTHKLFITAEEGRALQFENVAAEIKDLCEKMKENRKYLLLAINAQINKGSEMDENFNATHSVRSAIISIVMGMYLKLPVHRLIELGIAALLHEIGMAKLPPGIYTSRGKLSQKELEVLRMHPAYGFEFLKNSSFPVAVSAAALEHHERENGTGYPRKLTGENIGFYSKIIAVACSYAAITANRPHQDARGGYEGVTDLLRNEGKQYDEAIVRVLVFSLSVYPIGQFVLLSDGKKGQVIDINPGAPRFPIVQIFSEQTPDGKNRIIETSQHGIHIVKPLDKEDMPVKPQ